MAIYALGFATFTGIFSPLIYYLKTWLKEKWRSSKVPVICFVILWCFVCLYGNAFLGLGWSIIIGRPFGPKICNLNSYESLISAYCWLGGIFVCLSIDGVYLLLIGTGALIHVICSECKEVSTKYEQQYLLIV